MRTKRPQQIPSSYFQDFYEGHIKARAQVTSMVSET
jgi:hypothetical protein